MSNTITIQEIYKFRHILSPIYTQDIRFESDLVDSMYDSLSDTKLIETYEFDLSNNNISITLVDNASKSDIDSIINSISNTIFEYVSKNIKNINLSSLLESEIKQFNEFATHPELLYEFFIIGNKINITL